MEEESVLSDVTELPSERAVVVATSEAEAEAVLRSVEASVVTAAAAMARAEASTVRDLMLLGMLRECSARVVYFVEIKRVSKLCNEGMDEQRIIEYRMLLIHI